MPPMNITLSDLFVVLFVHWLADFVTQADKIAKAKSHSLWFLFEHVLTYTAVTSIGSFFLFFVFGRIAPGLVLGWALFNGAAHFVTDYFTSKWVSHFFAKQDHHNGFVIIGLDQVIHLVCLTWSLAYLRTLIPV